MNLRIKICGMRDPVNITETAELLPDYMGFIFYKESPRYAGEVFSIPSLPQSVKRIGVFVNERTDSVLEKSDQYDLDFIQLHGNETPRYCEDLKSKGLNVIKAFSVDEHFDFSNIIPYQEFVNYFLFDKKGKYYGGNAETFNWTLLRKYNQQIPFFLSGGISCENIIHIANIQNLNIHALDVNSGVEISPALKSIEKIKELKRVLNSL